VLKPEIAYQINHILADVEAKRATFGRLLNVLTVRGHTVAAKTGTTNNFKDAWTLGYTPSIVAGVWAGNNNGDEMDHGGGSTVAAPIWHAFMAKYLAGKPAEQFHRPSTITDHTVDFLSGKNPTSASTQLVTDIFAPWQIPTKTDDVHVSIKVCKSNGLLATENTPAEETEDRVFTKVRSERPDNPAWEGPVQAWARGAGLVNEPPTQKCDITFTDPKITISSPGNGATVSGIFTVAADVTFPPNTSGSVDFFVDGAFQTKDSSDPFTATIDASDLSSGSHEITATVNTSNGRSATSKITITVGQDTSPPGNVSSVFLVPQSGGRARATWTNPGDTDLEEVQIYASQASGVKGAKVATVNANPGDSQTHTVTGLASGVTNYLTFVTVDKSNNASTTTQQYQVIPL
jgi:membrane carboxypeptidase/penicillin-binding protein PbpC